MNPDSNARKDVAASPAPWRIVPYAQAKIPDAPAGDLHSSITESAKRVLFGAETRDRPKPDDKGGVEFVGLDVETLYAITPTFRPPLLSSALDEALADWARPEHPPQGRAFVGMPHSGLQSALEHWARAREMNVIAPPDPHALITGDLSVLDGVKDSPAPFVVPALERWFLRDALGLALVRRLWDLLLASRQRWIVGCDSWAWAFLRHLGPIDDLAPLTLSPLQASELERWLRVDWTARQAPPFRYADDESPVFRDASDDDAEPAKYFRRMAAHSRGLAPVALAMWRRSLSQRHVAGESNGSGKEASGQPPGTTGDGAAAGERSAPADQAFWVRPWDEVGSPKVRGELEKADVLALHAILLHGGLTAPLLERATRLHRPELDWSLRRLADHEVLTCDEGLWRTTELGYPVAQALLHSEGYLTDEQVPT